MPEYLSLCCGTGRLTLPIAKDGYDISGVDYTASMLHQAKMKASRGWTKNQFHSGGYQDSGFTGEVRPYFLFHLIRSIIYMRMKIYLRYFMSLKITSKTEAYFCWIVLIRIFGI